MSTNPQASIPLQLYHTPLSYHGCNQHTKIGLLSQWHYSAVTIAWSHMSSFPTLLVHNQEQFTTFSQHGVNFSKSITISTSNVSMATFGPWHYTAPPRVALESTCLPLQVLPSQPSLFISAVWRMSHLILFTPPSPHLFHYTTTSWTMIWHFQLLPLMTQGDHEPDNNQMYALNIISNAITQFLFRGVCRQTYPPHSTHSFHNHPNETFEDRKPLSPISLPAFHD